MDIRVKLMEYNKKTGAKLTPKQYRELYDHVIDEALEYFFDTVEEESYFTSLIKDLQANRL